jgi:hypothetical protein
MANSVANETNRIHLKSVALPAEHGGWGFLIEPMILGMLVAPSAAGLWLCLAALGAFLLHQPAKIALKDWRRRRSFERTRWAARFTLLYGGIAVLGLVGALTTALATFWLPLLIIVPVACIHFAYEASNQGRELLPEMLGSITLSASAPMIALAANVPLDQAFLLWAILILRILPSILYVRARLRRAKGKPVSLAIPILAHAGVLLLTVLFVVSSSANGFVILAAALLLARAFYGLKFAPPTTPAKSIGFQEMGFGLGYVVLCALAFG